MGDLNLQLDPDFLFGAGGPSFPIDVLAAQAQTGPISFNSGGSSGFAFSATSGGGNAYTATVSVSNQGTARTSLGLGTLAVRNAAAASADVAAPIGAVFSQAEVQAILDELRDLKAKLKTAVILTP